MPTPGNPVCKKTIRETCDDQKHTMKFKLPGIMCVKNSTDASDCDKHIMKCQHPGILCVKKQYAKRVMFKNTP